MYGGMLPASTFNSSFVSGRIRRKVAHCAPGGGFAPAIMTFRMTLTQLDIFYDFYGDDLADGSLSFTWTHPLTGNDRDWLFAPDQVPKVRRVTPNTVTVDLQLITIT